MKQISSYDMAARTRQMREGIATAIKWWAEHQAWPATDEIRIEGCHPRRG